VRAFPGNGKPRDAELAELRKEVKNLREERDILRKAVAIFSKPPR
jgi:transposase